MQSAADSAKQRAWTVTLDLIAASDEGRTRLAAFSPAEYRETFARQDRWPIDPDVVEKLLALNQQQSVLNRGRIHPSWFAALRSKLPPQTRHFMRTSSAEHGTTGLLHAIMADSVDSLWAERLVGDLEPQQKDSTIVRLLAGDSRIMWIRRLVWCGRLKRIIAGCPGRPSESQLSAGLVANLPADWQTLALGSVNTYEKNAKSRKNSRARLGLVTMASLTGSVDHRRRQWMLQHFGMDLGVTLAPWMRIGKPPLPQELLDLESWILGHALKLAAGETLEMPPVQDQVAGTDDIQAISTTLALSGVIQENNEEAAALVVATEMVAIDDIVEIEDSEEFVEIVEAENQPIEIEMPNVVKLESDMDFNLNLDEPVDRDALTQQSEAPVVAPTSPASPPASAPTPAPVVANEDHDVEESIELLSIHHQDSGLFDLDLNDINLDTDDSHPNLSRLHQDHGVTEPDEENKTNDDSGSSFALGDLEL